MLLLHKGNKHPTSKSARLRTKEIVKKRTETLKFAKRCEKNHINVVLLSINIAAVSGASYNSVVNYASGFFHNYNVIRLLPYFHDFLSAITSDVYDSLGK